MRMVSHMPPARGAARESREVEPGYTARDGAPSLTAGRSGGFAGSPVYSFSSACMEISQGVPVGPHCSSVVESRSRTKYPHQEPSPNTSGCA